MRYLALFLAAMFFANNVAAAIRACIADAAMQEHAAAMVDAAAASHPLCPQQDESGPCLTHYAESYQGDEQKAWAGFPGVAPVPVVAALPAIVHAKPKDRFYASAPPVVGPPLTILFGNFRN